MAIHSFYEVLIWKKNHIEVKETSKKKIEEDLLAHNGKAYHTTDIESHD